MSGTILLADDSLTIQKVVELTFADTDFRVVAVSSGDDLLERLRDSQPDLVICDVIMPGIDGYEVCQQIKSNSDWLHLPVILLTGTFEPFDRDRAIAAGCSEIITKPFEARKLVDTVERLIGGPDVQTPAPDAPPAASEETWPEEATPVEIPEPAETEEFGTQLSQPEPEPAEDDGIEFTTSGFAEMEAAGQQPRDPAPAAESGDGLEFEFGATDEPEDVSAQTVKIDLSSISPEALADEAAGAADDAPDVAEPPPVEPVQPPEAAPEPVAEAAVEAAPEQAQAPADDAPAEDTPEFKDESSMADTSPVDPPDEPEAAAAPVTTGASLSDDDIDRIARRVVELASDRLEQIAWEVVPDMAEIVVRQRIRELEAEAENVHPESVQ